MSPAKKKHLFSEAESKKFFTRFNISIPDGYEFSNFNFIIGTNGCGKTRFLKAVRESYRASGSPVVYSYFPELACSKSSIKKAKELPDCSLYEYLLSNDYEFDDFLREIEQHNDDFIPQLLVYHSKQQKTIGEKTFKLLQDNFQSLSDKTLVIEDNALLMEQKDGKKLLLKKALGMFSPGELMIFYLAIFICLQSNTKQERILILDEPECHLHPKALLKFIQMLRNEMQFSEIWIASHSLFILPELTFEQIVYINDSQIIPRTSRLYQAILSDVLGENRANLETFFSSLSQWQYCEYIAECFANPEVIDTVSSKDEQVRLFASFLAEQPNINVLDYGGGSGRLGFSLLALDKTILRRIKYEIYDPHPQHDGSTFCIRTNLTRVPKKYHCVVLMNVLHEIEHTEWIDIFQTISRILKDDGYLIFAETKVLSKGEMPNKNGFLLLGADELSVLFAHEQHFPEIRISESQKTICVPVPKVALSNISPETIRNAIIRLKKNSYENLKKERANSSFRSSRTYAFWSQQYINAMLVCESFPQQPQKYQFEQTLSPDSKPISFSTLLLNPMLKQIITPERKTQACQILSTPYGLEAIYELNELLYIKLREHLHAHAFGEHDSYAFIEECWNQIPMYEQKAQNAKAIARLLLCMLLLGDRSERCINKIKSPYYAQDVLRFWHDLNTKIRMSK